MSNSTNALSTLISPRFEPGGERRMAGSVVPRAGLTGGERDEMYVLLDAYFAGTHHAQFEADLAEKEAVILLRDADTRQIQGFSTIMRLSSCIDGREVVAFFSGDTIVAREYWGDSLLSRLWSQMVFAEADLIIAERPGARVYWYLISSGYRTWRFLPVFFREFYPNPEKATPPHQQHILDILGRRKYGNQYLAGTGVVRLRSAAPLRYGVGEVTDHRLRDPQVAFFARMNPRHAEGDELACLTEITRTNLTRAGERMVAARVKQS